MQTLFNAFYGRFGSAWRFAGLVRGSAAQMTETLVPVLQGPERTHSAVALQGYDARRLNNEQMERGRPGIRALG